MPDYDHRMVIPSRADSTAQERPGGVKGTDAVRGSGMGRGRADEFEKAELVNAAEAGFQ
ncbi:MAG: hypothetical protein ACRDPY_48955 [Streptosporangiaceae bacterium]